MWRSLVTRVAKAVDGGMTQPRLIAAGPPGGSPKGDDMLRENRLG
jgi:hypothetical protein